MHAAMRSGVTSTSPPLRVVSLATYIQILSYIDMYTLGLSLFIYTDPILNRYLLHYIQIYTMCAAMRSMVASTSPPFRLVSFLKSKGT